MKARMRPATRTVPVWPALTLVLALAGCATQQAQLADLGADAEPEISAERAAVIVDIRQKAEAARQADTGAEANIYQSYGPPEDNRRTYAEVRAIQAELDALAEASQRSSDPAEIAALRREAARLEALRKKVELDGAAGSGSIDQ